MNIKKTLTVILLALSLTITVFGNTYTKEYTITNNDEFFEVSGTLPIVTTENSSLNKILNDKITNVYETKLENAKKSNITKLDFSYEVITYEQYVSIILYTKTTNLGTTTYTDTLVYDKDTNKIISLEDFSEIIPSIQLDNEKISNDISIKTNSSLIDSKQNNFYIEEESIVLINPVTTGEEIEHSKFQLSEIETYKISKDDYYIKGTYKIIMVPLRETLENLGYKVSYRSFDKPIEISKEGKTYYISLNKNVYANETTTTSLEVLPEVINDETFIPISFFSEILNVYYNINLDESISFENK